MEQQPSLFDPFPNKEKAILHALWMNFKYRIAKISFGVIKHPKSTYAVYEEATAKEMKLSFLDILSKNLSKMDYDIIRHIKMDNDPLPHWESIIGLFSTVDGEILRYLLHNKISLGKLIRHELAGRGHDENQRYCGFEKAEEIWLK